MNEKGKRIMEISEIMREIWEVDESLFGVRQELKSVRKQLGKKILEIQEEGKQ